MAIYAQDIQLDTDGDLLVRHGDFVADLSDEDHISDILISPPGTYKQWPMLGVDIMNELNSPNGGGNAHTLERLIRISLNADNYEVGTMTLTDKENFNIQAERTA